MNKDIEKIFDILYSKREEMENFFGYYLFNTMKINRNEFIDDKEQFMIFIDFCLNTRQRQKNIDLIEGTKYFDKKYTVIANSIKENNISALRNIVYSAKGVGQKIGSLILEVIYLYSNYKDENIAKELFVPIDTHTGRMFKDSLGINVPRDYQLKFDNKKFIEFQNSLNEYTNNRSRIYFDYLWFIGKMFCSKIKNEKSRGFRLCKYCWIKDYCRNEKWL